MIRVIIVVVIRLVVVVVVIIIVVMDSERIVTAAVPENLNTKLWILDRPPNSSSSVEDFLHLGLRSVF